MTDERTVVTIEPEAAALQKQIDEDYTAALRGRNTVVVGTLRMLRAAVQEVLVARTDTRRKDFGQPLTGSDVIGVINKQIKQREESAEAFDKAGLKDRAQTERDEAEVLRRYLPRQMGREEIVVVVQRLVAEVGPDFRKVMPAAAQELRGKADGKLVQQVVREMTGA